MRSLVFIASEILTDKKQKTSKGLLLKGFKESNVLKTRRPAPPREKSLLRLPAAAQRAVQGDLRQ